MLSFLAEEKPNNEMQCHYWILARDLPDVVEPRDAQKAAAGVCPAFTFAGSHRRAKNSREKRTWKIEFS
ncbi:hypothetical protein VTK26DRAFT_2687 [Humicola hyalothermophila]